HKPQTFKVRSLDHASLPAEDFRAMLAFQQKTGALQRAVLGASRLMKETEDRLLRIKGAIQSFPGISPGLIIEARRLEAELTDLQVCMTGDPIKSRRNYPVPPGIIDRVQRIVSGHWDSSRSDPTQTQRRSYEIAASLFEPLQIRLKKLVEIDLPAIEETMEKAGVPWTSGRIPQWKR
ncbi:MAG: glycosyl hydrolase, partial [Planctomycetota bacterium]